MTFLGLSKDQSYRSRLSRAGRSVESWAKPIMTVLLEDWTGLLRHEASFCLVFRA
jgi:hypothetical protein